MNRRMAVTTACLVLTGISVDAQSVDRIAFQAQPLDDMSVPYQIFSMNLDGSSWVNLSNSSSNDIHPAWSPDGEKIAFASDRKGSYQIFLMNADGSDPEQLTSTPGNHFTPAWSPDGQQLAYSSNEQGDHDIYVMRADGSDAVNVTEHPGHDYAPSWSPDGTKLAFASDRDREQTQIYWWYPYKIFSSVPSDIFVMDALGGTATNLTFATAGGLDPQWSPDGQRIAFVQILFRRSLRIGLLDEGGGVELFDGHPSTFHTPAWSPDGSALVFTGLVIVRGRTQGLGLWSVPASDGTRTQLTGIDWVAIHPTWSPMSMAPPSTNVQQTAWGALKRWLKQGREEAQE